MNHIYRLIWNKKRRMLVAVAEVGNAQGKEGSSNDAPATAAGRTHVPGALTLMAAAVIALFPALAQAQGGGELHIPVGAAAYLSDGDGSNAMAAGWTIRNDGTLDISATDAGTSLQSLSGSGMVLLGERLLTLTDASSLFAGGIHGSGGLALAGGFEILSGTNTYFGATTVAGEATLALAGSGSIALSSALTNNGTFDIAATDRGATLRSLAGADSGSVLLGGQTLTLSAASDEYAGRIRGDGGITVAGGRQVMSGANDYTGVTAIASDAVLALSGSGSIALSSSVHTDGEFDLRAVSGAEVRSLSGSGTVLLGGGDLNLSGAADDFAGVIDGQGGLTVSHGTQVLSGANTYTGATSIGNDGRLALSGDGAIAFSSGLANNGVFDIAATRDGAEIKSMSGSGTVLLGGQTLTLTQASDVFDGSLQGSGGLTLAAGQLVLTAEQQHTGVTAIANGAWMSLLDQGSIAQSRSVVVDGVLDVMGRTGGAELQSLSGSGAVLLGGDSLTLTNAGDRFDGGIHGAGGLVVGGGSQTLAGFNSYSGVTVVASGARLGLGESGAIALSSGVIANGVFDIAQTASGATVRSLAGAGEVVLGGKSLTLSRANDEFAGAINGSGGLALDAGTQVLSGVNGYSGDTTVAQGAALVLAGNGSIGNSRLDLDGVLDVHASNGNAAVKSLAGSGLVFLGDADLTITNGNDHFDGGIHGFGAGGLVVGGGNQILNGFNGYSGATTIAAGASLGLGESGSIALSRGVIADGVFDIAQTAGGATVRSLSGAGEVLLGANTLTLSGANGDFAGTIDGSGGLALAAGTQVLSGVNTYTGATSVGSDAVLALNGSGAIAFSSALANDGVFDIAATNHGAEIKSLSGSGAVLLGGQTLTITQANDTFAGVLHGSGGLTLAGGDLVLTGENQHTGVTAIDASAGLSLAGSGSIALSRSVLVDGVLALQARDGGTQLQSLSGAGAVLLGDTDLTITNGNDRFDGSIAGAGGLTVGAGTQVLGGMNSYEGATTIASGASLGLGESGAIALSSGVLADGVFDIGQTASGATVRSLSGAGEVLLGGNTLTLSEASGNFSGAINGSGGLALDAGTQVLSGVNGYSGDTQVAQGASLVLSGNGSIAQSRVDIDGVLDVHASNGGVAVKSLAGAGAVVLGNTDLTLNQANDRFDGAIVGAGGLKVSAGNQVLAGVNGYEGATTIAAGASLGLGESGSIALSSGVLADGVFDIGQSASGATVRSLSGAGEVLLGGNTLTLSEASGNFSGAINGSGGLALDAGTQVLSGVNGYSGDTQVAQGASLVLSGNGSIAQSRVDIDGVLDVHASNGGVAVKSLAGAGAVVLGNTDLTLNQANDRFDGAIVGAGGLKVSAGNQVLAGVNGYEGATTIAVGARLGLGESGSIALSSGVLADGVFDIEATAAGAEVRSLSGAGKVLLGQHTLTLGDASGNFTGTINGAGGLALDAGTQTLGGVNGYRGDTTVAQGAALALAGDGSIGNSRLDLAGTLDIHTSNGGAAVKSLHGEGEVLLGSKTLTVTDAGDSFTGAISGQGGIRVAGGNQVLSGHHTFSGATAIDAGATLGLSGSGSLALSSGVLADGTFDIAAINGGTSIQSLSGSGAVSLGNASLTLTDADSRFSGSIGGAGSVQVAAGRQTLSGRNTYSGDTVIASGATVALAGDGSLADSRVTGNGTLEIARTGGNAAVKGLGGNGVVSLGGRTLTLTGAADDFGGIINGSGGIALAAGLQAISAAQDYTGTTSVASDATLALRGQGSIAASSLNLNGKLDATAAAHGVAIRSLSGAGSVLLGANDLNVTAGDGEFTGKISGSGGLNLSGGMLSLSGTNSYLGKTSVSNAVLRTVADANLGLGLSALELDNGTWQTGADLTHSRGLLLAGRGTVDVDAATTTVETGVVGGSGALVKAGDGTLVLNGVVANAGGVTVKDGVLALGAANTYSGTTSVASGAVLRIDNDANLGKTDNRLVLDGGALQTTGTMESARAIGITGATGTFDTLGADSVVTLAGNIDGAGRIVKEGAGTLVLAGDNAGGRGAANQVGDGWTGGLTINDGLVKVTNAWGLGWGSVLTFNGGTILATVDIATGQNIQVGRSTDINVVTGTTTTLTGDLISSGNGDGCFNKTGQGTLAVLGSARIDSTCVLEGKLLANGSFASRVTVARGATLGGAGSIQGDILVQGTLSPGNSPGMLTADSNIVMATGSTYKEDIGGATRASATTPIGVVGYYSYLHVVGGKQFTIQPGVTLAPALKDLYTRDEAGYGSTPYVPQLGQTFRIITAEGGINGRFDTLAQPDGLAQDTRMAAFYNQGGSNSIELKVLPKSYASWRQDANGNSRSVGAALDTIVDLDAAGKGSAAQTALLYNTASYGASQLGSVVQGLSGEVHGALAAAQPQAGWDLQRTLLKRGESIDGRALWLDLGAGRAKWSGDAAASGFEGDRFQATVGLDLLQAPGQRLGFGVSHTGTDLDAEGGKGKLRQTKLFAYGEQAAGAMVFDVSASHGRDKLESQRADPFAPGAVLAGDASGSSSLIGIGARLPRVVGGATFEPFARLSVQRVERDALAETPASGAALALDRWSATGTRLVAGLGGSSRNTDPLQASTWRFNLGAGVDGGDLLRPQLGASLAGTGFTVGAPDVGRAFVQGGVNGTLQIRKGAYLFFGVTGEARSSYYTVGGNAGVRAQF